MITQDLREMPSSLNDACRKLELAAHEIDTLRARAAEQPTEEAVAASTLYLERSKVRSILVGQPDENLHITEGVLAEIDALPILTAAEIAPPPAAGGFEAGLRADWPSIDHSQRPSACYTERQWLKSRIEQFGPEIVVQTLMTYARSAPKEGSYAASLWVIAEWLNAAIAAIPAPAQPTVEEVAKIIDPASFIGWQGQYDYSRKSDGDEFARRCADSFYKKACDEALAKAEAIHARYATYSITKREI